MRRLQVSTAGWDGRGEHTTALTEPLGYRGLWGLQQRSWRVAKGKRHGSISLAQGAETKPWVTLPSMKDKLLQAQKLNF